jgi:glycosyltransferase involved in cell wall biosynthesis
MQARVSIIVPTYNRARLVRAIDSTLAQTYVNLDVVVVDDGSTDDTWSVLQAYRADPRIRLIRLDRNRGVTAAKNAGLAAIEGGTSYAGILDSDDSLMPDAIARLVGVFEATGDRYSQVFGWCRDRLSGESTGRMTHREGPVTYDDVLTGRFNGEFWQLARCDLIADRRFDERASGAEPSVWWPLLKISDGWLIGADVRTYDSSGSDRVSRIQYTRCDAAGRMWACHAALVAVGEDLRTRYPAQYGGRQAELAKWEAMAGEGAIDRRASREALRYAPSRRSVSMAVLCFAPSALLRAAAGSRASLSARRLQERPQP